MLSEFQYKKTNFFWECVDWIKQKAIKIRSMDSFYSDSIESTLIYTEEEEIKKKLCDQIRSQSKTFWMALRWLENELTPA